MLSSAESTAPRKTIRHLAGPSVKREAEIRIEFVRLHSKPGSGELEASRPKKGVHNPGSPAC
jgi:hypothetical protein